MSYCCVTVTKKKKKKKNATSKQNFSIKHKPKFVNLNHCLNELIFGLILQTSVRRFRSKFEVQTFRFVFRFEYDDASFTEYLSKIDRMFKNMSFFMPENYLPFLVYFPGSKVRYSCQISMLIIFWPGMGQRKDILCEQL